MNRRSGLAIALGLSLLSATTPKAQTNRAPSIYERIAAHTRTIDADLIAFRRDLHRHPEGSFQEARTSRVIAERLRALGLDVQTDVGGYGVVGILKGAKPGPLVAYRADMDAVSSSDPDPVDFRSETPGIRHICGHDLHMTIAIGLASALTSVKADLTGSVMFIFQPAEERAAGAKAMLDAGLFATRIPAAIFGLHTSPSDVGRITTRGGRMMLANFGAPGVVNDDALAARARSDLIAVLGAGAVGDAGDPPAGFSEDFGLYQARVPGVFFFLGASHTAGGIIAMPHSAGFAIDESAIDFGVRAMAAVILGALGR